MSKDKQNGCKKCGSTCGVPDCQVCKDQTLCQKCQRQQAADRLSPSHPEGKQLWVRIGDAGEYESFGDDLDALIGYLNELRAGEVTGWVDNGIGIGIETVNYHGCDFISLFWGDRYGNLIQGLDAQKQAAVENGLEEAYI
jgi:hypothetical protein